MCAYLSCICCVHIWLTYVSCRCKDLFDFFFFVCFVCLFTVVVYRVGVHGIYVCRYVDTCELALHKKVSR